MMIARRNVFPVAAALLAGLRAPASAQDASDQSGPDSGAYDGPPSASSDPASAGDVPVLAITGVEVVRTTLAPSVDIVYATGIATSNGWGAPQLVPTYTGKPADDVLDLELVATPPDDSPPASGFVPVSAVLALDPGHTFKGVRVRSAENAVFLAKLPGSAQASTTLLDCKDCVGKRFAPAGQAASGDRGIVRREDLPKALRLIGPNDGIHSADQDPNRLTLMLGEDETILQAYWE